MAIDKLGGLWYNAIKRGVHYVKNLFVGGCAGRMGG